ncbi:acetate/propionate family kinase [Candidatus Falkowbacteria bacterium]|nr:acetate/propionate family kinase [Candidatus Falkowbacteria bacterium]
MRSILTINSGSTSLKYKLIDLDDFRIMAENNLQGIESHSEAFKRTLREVGNLSAVKVVGHRVVHGGDEFFEPVEITKEVLKKIESYSNLAPLHNPYNLAGVRASNEFIPNIPDFAVFDTAFYRDLPDRAKIYGLPYEFYKEHGIRRFGFHGISHKYVAMEAAKELKKELKDLNLVTCHLGGGVSITAIKKGKAIDTSMGFTPMEGPMMMTRCGDIDPGVVLKLKDSLNGNDKGMVGRILNKASGIKGISGIDDFLTLLEAVGNGDERAKLAFEIYTYRIEKYIGGYLAILGGADALVFTGQVGAGKATTRNKITKDLDKILGRTKVLTIETDEELMIAKEIAEKLGK